MNYKKILLVSLLILAVVSSLSVASAGWFDFGGDSANEDLNMTITDSDLIVNVELGDHTLNAVGGATMTENGWMGSFTIDGTPNKYSVNGNMSFDLSSLSEDQMKSLNECSGISNITFHLGDIEYSSPNVISDYKIEGNTLTINFDNTDFSVSGFDANVEEYDIDPSDVEFNLDGLENPVHAYGFK